MDGGFLGDLGDIFKSNVNDWFGVLVENERERPPQSTPVITSNPEVIPTTVAPIQPTGVPIAGYGMTGQNIWLWVAVGLVAVLLVLALVVL